MKDRNMVADRRTFLVGAGLSAALTIAQPLKAGETKAQPVLDQFDYSDVSLQGGLAQAQFSSTLETLLNFDDDALLRPFRQAAGMPVAAKGFGGWYDASPDFRPPNMHGFIPGHSFGQYVSAMARAYAITGDVRAQSKVRRLIDGFGLTVGAKFYEGYPLPAYTYDKTVMGLIDAHLFAGSQNALSILGQATDAVLPFLPDRALDRLNAADQATRPQTSPAFAWDETYTLPENLYLAAARSGDARYHALAQRYLLDAPYFDKLAAGENVLPGRHAYSHLNALNSAMQAYLSDGSQKHLLAARNGLAFILDQSFATGGWGPGESFVAPESGGLGASLQTMHSSFEGPCGTYGHFKLARYLIRVTGDSRYGDGMERLLYNVSLGALPLKANGAAFYYADYNDIGTKTYHESNCPCCSGSIGQLTADYGISSYFKDATSLFVNLYLPSTVTWRDKHGRALALTQTTNYPLEPNIVMEVKTAGSVRMALRPRIPAWAGPVTVVKINGQAWTGGLTPGAFATIDRVWADGDKIELTIDMPLRYETVDKQHLDRLAAVQGPLALFATGDRFTSFTKTELASLSQSSQGSTDWLITTDAGTQVFKPYFAIKTEPTRLYQFLS